MEKNDYPGTKEELLKEEFGFEIESQTKRDGKSSQKVTEKKYSESEWGEYTVKDLLEVLGQTVKKDDFNKLLVFLCQLLAYTEDNQINVSFNAPSSSGKSYLALEIAELFPKEDVIKLGYASPTSFFHTTSTYDKERRAFVVNLERKIVIFLDMPHSLLLQHLRPLLSHDQKEILVKITDRSKKFGIKTKDIYIRGYPAVLFCSALFKLDEQELTRFILLSPETTQEKIREAIHEKVKKEANRKAYFRALEENPLRQALKARIKAIKKADIREIKLGNPEKLHQMFSERNKILKPRHTRDIQRISSLTKAFALLNLWNRNRKRSVIITNDTDLKNAYRIWDEISTAQELGVSPYVLSLYKEVILPAYDEKSKTGLTRQEVLKKHFEVYGRHLPDWQLRQDIIPMMEVAGLVSEERDPNDKRKILLYPLLQLTISQGGKNSGPDDDGVSSNEKEEQDDIISVAEKIFKAKAKQMELWREGVEK